MRGVRQGRLAVGTCQECGGTRRCDSSPNSHASKHARASGHRVIASAEPGERWLYCYPKNCSPSIEVMTITSRAASDP
ncbi:MAG TPA: UBP-type zinc finger domain-containing protein [Thermoanaerobaculia bacterium]|nr:UBP-type zinc finger domain-containing protein [Thermoanaerobaculia bacterium]